MNTKRSTGYDVPDGYELNLSDFALFLSVMKNKEAILNMKSRNGRPELISLLQYLKKKELSNPDIWVKDRRILKLDGIVQEVRQSEEWKA